MNLISKTTQNGPPVSQDDRTFIEDDDAYFEAIASHMSPDFEDTNSRFENVKDTYVLSSRDRLLSTQFRRLIGHILTKKNGRRDDGRVLFVTGESGAGKSEAIGNLIRTDPALQSYQTPIGPVSPAISISLSGLGTLKTLAVNILRAAGYDASHSRQQNELWDLLPAQLKLRKVLLIHIDETQHLLKETEADRERKNLANALKGLMNASQWPVSFIMSGLPITTELASLDEQFERRGRFVSLEDVHYPEDREMIINIISELSDAANLDATEIFQGDMPARITHAANNRYGRVCSIVTAAIQVALENNPTKLTRTNFIDAYLEHSQTLDAPELNPFIVDNWKFLAPGSFLYEKGAR